MRIKMKGLEQLQARLKKVAAGVAKVSGEHQFSFPFSELLPESFMRAHCRAGSLAELLADGGFVANSADEFAAIPNDAWDAHIQSHTSFGSWKEMLSAGSREWARRQIGL